MGKRVYAQRCRGTQGEPKRALGWLLGCKEVHFRFAEQIPNLDYCLMVQHPFPRPEFLPRQKKSAARFKIPRTWTALRERNLSWDQRRRWHSGCTTVNPLGDLWGIPPPCCPSWLSHGTSWEEGESESVPGRRLWDPGSLCARRGTQSAFEECAPACHWCLRRNHVATVNRIYSDSTPEKSGVWTDLNGIQSEGGFGQTEVCSRTKLCGEPKAIPLVDATIRERNAIEEVECCNEAYLCCGVQKVWRKWRPPPWRKAVGVLVQDDGERGTRLKNGRCGACTL